MSRYGALCLISVFLVTRATLLKPSSSVESFNQCLITNPASLGYCLGIGALSKLQNIDNNPEFDLVDGVTFARDEQQIRESYSVVDKDPGDLRTIVDSVGEVFSRRTMRWDMGAIHPGLALRVAPSTSPGGVLEFVLDPHREALSHHSLKEASTGRLITRQFLLPFLLGFKFNVATIVPVIFGLLALIAKKFLFLSKIGLIISSAVGLGSLLFSSSYGPTTGGGFNPSFGGQYAQSPYNRLPDEDYYENPLYRGFNEENHVKFFNEMKQSYAREDAPSGNGRNFAWNEAEKETKT